MFVANPGKRCDLFEIQTQCCFPQEMWWDKFLVLQKTTHRPQLGLSHQDSQKQIKSWYQNLFRSVIINLQY